MSLLVPPTPPDSVFDNEAVECLDHATHTLSEFAYSLAAAIAAEEGSSSGGRLVIEHGHAIDAVELLMSELINSRAMTRIANTCFNQSDELQSKHVEDDFDAFAAVGPVGRLPRFRRPETYTVIGSFMLGASFSVLLLKFLAPEVASDQPWFWTSSVSLALSGITLIVGAWIFKMSFSLD